MSISRKTLHKNEVSSDLQAQGSDHFDEIQRRKIILIPPRRDQRLQLQLQELNSGSTPPAATPLSETEEDELFKKYPKKPDACLWISDQRTGSLLFVQENFKEIWGSDSAILKDGTTGFVNSIFPADKDHVLATFHTNLESGFETDFRTIDELGELQWINLKCDLFRPEKNSELVRLVFRAIDSTEAHYLKERAQREKQDRAQSQSLKDLSSLAATVSAEINLPLNALFKQLEQLKKQLGAVTSITPQGAKYAAAAAIEANQAAERIERIYLGLRTLAQQEPADSKLEHVPLHQIFTSARELTVGLHRMAPVKLIFPTLPAKLTIEVHRPLMIQALMHLFTNSVEAVSSSPGAWIEVDWTDDRDSVFIYITDSGNGIAIKNRGHIFEPFFSTKEGKAHIGIGLSHARQLIGKYKGTLVLDSLNTHTRFVIQIPKRQSKT